MFRRAKLLLYVIPASLALTAFTAVMCVLESNLAIPHEYWVLGTVILCVWAFFTAPSYLFVIEWINMHLNLRQSFFLGLILGSLALILPVLTAPVTGIIWYVNLIAEMKKHGRRHKADKNGGDVFDI